MTQEIKAGVETITPARAKAMLQANTHNRNVNDRRVALYMRSMRHGEWDINGEAIKITTDGTILDGQHRLLAVVRSGVTIRSLVVTGLPTRAQETMDQGMKRNLADILKLRGERNVVKTASLLGALVRWEKYKPEAALKSGSYEITIAEQLDYLETHPEVRDMVSAASNAARNLPISYRTTAILWAKLHEASDDLADLFFDSLQTGAGMEEDDPILLYRNWCYRAERSNKVSVDQTFMLGMGIKAWNLMVSGRTVKSLTLRLYGAGSEKFPTPLVPMQETI